MTETVQIIALNSDEAIRYLFRKLINAYHKISAGEPATVAALECGFNDYSGFYKQYVKAFGFPPSKR